MDLNADEEEEGTYKYQPLTKLPYFPKCLEPEVTNSGLGIEDKDGMNFIFNKYAPTLKDLTWQGAKFVTEKGEMFTIFSK